MEISTSLKRHLSRTGISFFLCFSCFYSATANVTYASPLKIAEFAMGNMLEWSTATEKNSHFFLVERSEDGHNFISVSKQILSAGDSQKELSYHFLDITAKGDVYYRLKQFDINGTYSYSQTIYVRKAIPNHFAVVNISNTATDKLFVITIDAVAKMLLNYSVLNYEGEMIFKTEQEMITGLNEIEIDLNEQEDGIYKVILEMGEEKETLVIQKIDNARKKQSVASKKDSDKG